MNISLEWAIVLSVLVYSIGKMLHPIVHHWAHTKSVKEIQEIQK